jgi:hypothetical protein
VILTQVDFSKIICIIVKNIKKKDFYFKTLNEKKNLLFFPMEPTITFLEFNRSMPNTTSIDCSTITIYIMIVNYYQSQSRFHRITVELIVNFYGEITKNEPNLNSTSWPKRNILVTLILKLFYSRNEISCSLIFHIFINCKEIKSIKALHDSCLYSQEFQPNKNN